MRPSAWGRRAAAAYLLLLSATLGYLTYHLLFNRSRFSFPGTTLVTLGLPWTRLFAGTLPVLLVSFGANLAMLYFIGSSLEQLARGERG